MSAPGPDKTTGPDEPAKPDKEDELPGTYVRFRRDYPDVAKGYDAFGEACYEAGPLDRRTLSLVKLGISMGAQMEGAVHSHTRKALGAGVTPDELRHAVLMGMTTIGFPSAMAAKTWVEEVIQEQVGGED